ncbi:tail fiber domain-containing protein, partial [Fusobacterium ulcerans]|uniref:tail fiber domain-containing protein n=1 Tax=Fusobacterium ulcerans TaxID=861 RepID=UPI002670F909
DSVGNNIYTITLTNNATQDIIVPIGPQGIQGPKGEKGETMVASLKWNDILEKPTTFPSTWSEVSGIPSAFPTTWATVANKPATFPPAAGTITGNLTVTGVFVCNNDVTAFSDIRLKTNITQLTNALGKLDMINGYNFEYKDRAGEKQVGVIAQEVQTVLPEAVKLTERVFNGEKMLAVNEIKIVPLLIEAIKELKGEVDKLKGGKE